MAAKQNLTVQADFNGVTIREVDFVSRFSRNWQALQDILGIMRPIVKAPGTNRQDSSLKSQSHCFLDPYPCSFPAAPSIIGRFTPNQVF